MQRSINHQSLSFGLLHLFTVDKIIIERSKICWSKIIVIFGEESRMEPKLHTKITAFIECIIGELWPFDGTDGLLLSSPRHFGWVFEKRDRHRQPMPLRLLRRFLDDYRLHCIVVHIFFNRQDRALYLDHGLGRQGWFLFEVKINFYFQDFSIDGRLIDVWLNGLLCLHLLLFMLLDELLFIRYNQIECFQQLADENSLIPIDFEHLSKQGDKLITKVIHPHNVLKSLLLGSLLYTGWHIVLLIELLFWEELAKLENIVYLSIRCQQRLSEDQLCNDQTCCKDHRAFINSFACQYAFRGRVPKILQLDEVQFREIAVGEGLNMSNFKCEVVATGKKGRGSDLSGYNLMLVELNDHLNEGSAEFEDVFLLQLCPDDCVQVEFQVIEDAVEVVFIPDDFLEVGHGFDFGVIHECNVFVFKYFFPGGFLVKFLDRDYFSRVCVFGLEEGEPFGFDQTFKHSVLIHLLQFYQTFKPSTITKYRVNTNPFQDQDITKSELELVSFEMSFEIPQTPQQFHTFIQLKRLPLLNILFLLFYLCTKAIY